MSKSEFCFSPLVAGLGAAIFLFATVLVTTDPAAASPRPEGAITCACAAAPARAEQDQPSPAATNPRFSLDSTDEIAALEAVHVALTEASDGATYVWHRSHGRLSGAVHVTSSFRDVDGKVCRHLVIMLSSGGYSRKIEGIACRTHGIWSLEG